MFGKVLLLPLAVPLLAAVSVSTGNYDISRDNANTSETVLNQSTVRQNFGQVAQLPVTGCTQNQPLVISGVSISGATTVVLIATLTNDVYLFNAVAPFNQLWHRNLGAPIVGLDNPQVPCGGTVGILSTPVIDTSLGVAYMTADLNSGGWTVFALKLADGTDYTSSVAVAATYSHSGYTTATFVSADALQRPGLALYSGNVYIGFGSIADRSPW